ncbi:MAG: VTT domain-containing protein [Candidatus Taylorbacteria bacterium]
MINSTFKNILKILAIPLILLFAYLSMVLLWKVFHFPSPDELTEIARRYFEMYGLWIVFVSALIEGFLIIGQYFPGGFVIFIGVVAARGNIFSVIEVLVVVGIAFFISYYLNYLMGRYGWYKIFLKFGLRNPIERAEEKLSRHTLTAILGSYWEPNLASITATAAGILRIKTEKFLVGSLLGIIIWNTFWGIVVYFIGEALLHNQTPVYLSIISFWCFLILLKVFVIDKKNNTPN